MEISRDRKKSHFDITFRIVSPIAEVVSLLFSDLVAFRSSATSVILSPVAAFPVVQAAVDQ